jgi:SP family myo-inositol transporter-like MFS transporter 13
MYYGPSIILGSGVRVGDLDPNAEKTGIILNIPIALMNAIGSLVTMFFIDKLGRRYIMIRLIPGIVLSLFLVSYSMYLSKYHEEGS